MRGHEQYMSTKHLLFLFELKYEPLVIKYHKITL